MIVTQHFGQHGASCFACKLKSLQFNRPGPKTHIKHGDHWEGNPVMDRIHELQAQGRRVAAMEISNPQAKEQ
jgi:hypothetical protein